MDTAFGLRGTIAPLFSKSQSWVRNQVQFSIENSVFEVGYEDAALRDGAAEAAKLYLAGHNLVNGTNYGVNLNESWQVLSGGTKAMGTEVSDTSRVTEGLKIRVNQVTTTGQARIEAPGFDSDDLENQTSLVEKCIADPALNSAVKYFNEEVIDNNRPLYGIYKALEALRRKCGGGAALGNLVGKGEKFVDDVMQTAQLTRHHKDRNAKRKLTDEECKERAKFLIMAYAGVQVAPPVVALTPAAAPTWAVGPKQVFCAACQAITFGDNQNVLHIVDPSKDPTFESFHCSLFKARLGRHYASFDEYFNDPVSN